MLDDSEKPQPILIEPSILKVISVVLKVARVESGDIFSWLGVA